jgi:hypothetical protein
MMVSYQQTKRLGWWMQYVQLNVHLTWKRRPEMQLGNRTRTVWGARERSIATARLSFNPALPREGRVMRGCRRALIARDGLVSMRELRSWCYPSQPRQHWHYWSIYEALKRLGAQRIGWGVFATYAQHSK